jgi:hypothetical protein
LVLLGITPVKGTHPLAETVPFLFANLRRNTHQGEVNLTFGENKCIIKTVSIQDNNMIPRFKKVKITIDSHLNKKQFLEEHNRLSPENLKATIPLLCRFRTENTSMFKDNSWSIDKIRRPFVSWLTSLTAEEKIDIDKKKS